MKEKLGKNTIKKGNSVAVFIFLIFKYRKKKFKESLKLVPVKKIECEIPPFFIDLYMEFYIDLHFVTDGVLDFLCFFFKSLFLNTNLMKSTPELFIIAPHFSTSNLCRKWTSRISD